MSKMETISLYEEGTGVHICIPNITVEEVKKLIAGLVVNQITSLLPSEGIKSENIPAEELEMNDNDIPTSEELNETRISEKSSETLNESDNELTDKASELPWNNVAEKSEDNNNNENPEEISETEIRETNDSADSADNSANEVTESAESESNGSNSVDNKAVIETAPDLNIDAETTDESVSENNIPENNSESNNSESIDDAAKETSSEESTSEKNAANDKDDTNEGNANNTNDSKLVLTIKPDKDYDKVLNGLKAVVYIKINNLPMEIVDNTIVINTNGLSESDIEYIKKMATITKSFEL